MSRLINHGIKDRRIIEKAEGIAKRGERLTLIKRGTHRTKPLGYRIRLVEVNGKYHLMTHQLYDKFLWRKGR